MDPCSILGLITTCAALASGAARLANQLRSIRGRFHFVHVRMQLLETQVRALKTATNRIAQWLKESEPCLDGNEDLAQDLRAVLEACDTLVDLLQEHASRALTKADRLGAMDLQTKIQAVWDEGDLKELQEQLRNQVQSLSLILQCFQLPLLADRVAMRESADMRESIKQARDTSSSIQRLADDESCMTVGTTGTQVSNSLSLSLQFDFDAEIVGSRVYRDTFAAIASNEPNTDLKVQALSNANLKCHGQRTSEENALPKYQNTLSGVLSANSGRKSELDALLASGDTAKATQLLQEWATCLELPHAAICTTAIRIILSEPQCKSVFHLLCALGDSDGVLEALGGSPGLADPAFLCICLRQLLQTKNEVHPGYLNVIRLLLAVGADFDGDGSDGKTAVDLLREYLRALRTDADRSTTSITIRPALYAAVITVILFHLFGADFYSNAMPVSAMDIFQPSFWVQKLSTYVHPVRDFMAPARERRVNAWVRSVLLATWNFREVQFQHKTLNFSSEILQFPRSIEGKSEKV